MSRRAFCLLFMFIMLSFPLQGCSLYKEAGPLKTDLAGSRINIVTSIFPLADILQNIGGELVEVTALLSAGASPHTYEPTVEQARIVARADLIVYVGGGLDDWILKLASMAEKEVILVEVMDFLEGFVLPHLPPCTTAHDEEHHEHEHEHEEDCCDHFHGFYDPHVWTDPFLVKEKIAPSLAEILAGIKPESKSEIMSNLKIFQEELQALHEEITAAVRSFTRKHFIAYHSAWNYFALRYGLEVVANVEEFPGKEPSAKWLSELVKLAGEHSVKVIFAEPQLSSKVAQVIAAEIEGKVLILDPLGGVGLTGRDSYIRLMRYNTEIFKQGLQ